MRARGCSPPANGGESTAQSSLARHSACSCRNHQSDGWEQGPCRGQRMTRSAGWTRLGARDAALRPRGQTFQACIEVQVRSRREESGRIDIRHYLEEAPLGKRAGWRGPLGSWKFFNRAWSTHCCRLNSGVWRSGFGEQQCKRPSEGCGPLGSWKFFNRAWSTHCCRLNLEFGMLDLVHTWLWGPWGPGSSSTARPPWFSVDFAVSSPLHTVEYRLLFVFARSFSWHKLPASGLWASVTRGSKNVSICENGFVEVLQPRHWPPGFRFRC